MEKESFSADTVDTKIIAYDILLVVGFYVTGVVILTAACSSRVRRSWNWYMAMTFWNLSCVEHLLLLSRQTGPQPPYGLCLIGAAFVYSAPSASAFATACLVVQFYATIHEVLLPRRGLEKLVSRTLLFIPPLVFTGVFTYSLMTGLQNPKLVIRSPIQVYCHIMDPFLPNFASSIVCFAAGLMIIFEALACYTICKRWQRIKNLKATIRDSVSVATLVRFCLFTIGPIVGVGLGVSRMGPRPHDTLTAASMEASYPIWAAVIFGTRSDILSVWMFWRPPKDSSTIISNSSDSNSKC